MRIVKLTQLFLLAVISAALPLAGQTTIRTAAGGGPNNVQALTAAIPGVAAVCSDAAGNIYFASDEMHRVFKVAATGMMTLIAGDTSPWNATLLGDGGPAKQAALLRPRGLAVDDVRNVLYISNQHSIRRVDLATGIITTYAGDGSAGFTGDGGPAARARISYPEGIGLDSGGNLYIADTGNRRVRRVDVSTQIISTVVGNGTLGDAGDGGAAIQANLRNVTSVVIDDSSGILYLADQYRVRKVSSGIINAFAGSVTSGFSGNGGPALSAKFGEIRSIASDSGGLYISDFNHSCVRKVNFSNGIVNAYAGTGTIGSTGDGGLAVDARLGLPWGLSIRKSDGSVLIVDNYSRVIRRVTTGGIIGTIAGSGSAEMWFGGDGGPATDALMYSPETVAYYRKNNQLFIGEASRIRKVNLSSGTISTIAEQHGGITGLAVDETRGFLYVADNDLCQINKIDLATNTSTAFAGGDQCGYSGDGGPPNLAKISLGASGVNVDSAGNVYIADTFNHVVRKVTVGTSPIITTIAGSGTMGYSGDGGSAISAKLSRLNAVAIDSTRNLLYIADTGNHRIRRVDLASGIITTLSGTGRNSYSGDGGLASAAELNGPKGVAVDDGGSIWITDSQNHRIRLVDRQTNIITTVAGTGTDGFSGDNGDPKAAMLDSPSCISLDASRNFFIADSHNMRVRQVLTPARQGRVDLLSSWAPDGLYQRNSVTGEWTKITSHASRVASSSDVTGDGLGDLVGIWSTFSNGGKLWMKGSEAGAWLPLANSAPSALAVADMNGDGKAEVLGLWGSDLWSFGYASGTGKWDLLFSISGTPDQIAAGDMDGDGKADLVATFSAVSGLWVKYSSTGAWKSLATAPDQFVCGDLNADGKSDIVGLWGSDIYSYDTASATWTFIASGASQVAAGDLDGDGKDDVIGIWDYYYSGNNGIWVHYSGSGAWAQLTVSQSVPVNIATIRVQ